MSKKQTNTPAKTTLQTLKDTLESLILAFVLAFVFRAFVVEAFVIPTGSMADTLRGAHFRIMCDNCAHPYRYNFSPEKYGFTKGGIPTFPMPLAPKRLRSIRPPACPFCAFQADKAQPRRVSNGDRILVLKYLYQFADPDRWDVVVFKNPTNPKENYIKRLVGKPGEKIEILDGDIYIDGIIQTKPDQIQKDLWIKIWDNNHQPFQNEARTRRGWGQPFKPLIGRKSLQTWVIDQKKHTFHFDAPDASETLNFHPMRLNRITKSTIAYNGPETEQLPAVSDLKFAATLTPESQDGQVTFTLGKHFTNYHATFEFNGQCSLINGTTGETLLQEKFPPLKSGQPINIAFATLDHTLQLQFGKS